MMHFDSEVTSSSLWEEGATLCQKEKAHARNVIPFYTTNIAILVLNHQLVPYSARFQVLSGLYCIIAFAIAAVRGPKSFWYTFPSEPTMNVMTPEFRYFAGYARIANPRVIFPFVM